MDEGKKQIPFTYNHPQSKIETTKGVSSTKGDTGSQTGHSVKETQSSSGMDSNLIQPSFYLCASIIIHSESASKHDVLASSKTGADFGLFALKDSISQTTGNDEGPNKLSLDHMFVGTNPSLLVDKTKSTGDGLKIAHTETCTNSESSETKKESKVDEDVAFGDDKFNTSPNLSSSYDTKKEIKLEDLSKLVQDVGTDFIDLVSPEDDEPS
ncbi:hypothetical protein Tco_1042830 [Tanacetum coccineum]|uniref:Uncharacterized protein n=1 Tax=Tanacetum coccineum TaxID=301880 RepID=A0ABQ5GKU4_9ASTR